MRRTKYTIAAAVFLIFLSPAVWAQQRSKTLSLDEAVAAAQEHSKAIQVAAIEEDIATAKYKQTEAIFLPQIGISYTALATNNPLNAFGFKLQEQSVTQADFDPARLNHPGNTQDITTKVELLQPLLNVDMLYMRRGAAKQAEVYKYRTLRTREYVTFEVTRAYLQMQLATNAVGVLEEALNTTRAIYTYTELHFKQGLVQKPDMLNAQVQVATLESSLAQARSGVRSACDQLSLLMGEQTGTSYIADSAKTSAGTTDPKMHALNNTRADFMAMQTAIDAYTLMVKGQKLNYLPRLNGFANYQLNDDRLTGFGANAYLAGIQLSWSIINGNRTRNTITTQTLERTKLQTQLAQQKEESQAQLDKALRDLDDAQLAVRQGIAAEAQATEALRIQQNRYQQGLVSTTDMLMAQTRLSEQKFALAQAIFTANVTRAFIQFLTTSNNK